MLNCLVGIPVLIHMCIIVLKKLVSSYPYLAAWLSYGKLSSGCVYAHLETLYGL